MREVDKAYGPYVKQKKPDTEEYMLEASIYELQKDKTKRWWLKPEE